SRDLVRDCPIAEVQLYDSGGMSSNERYLDIKNHCWKGSLSDWIVICDVDELIYHPDIERHLQNVDADILRCDGFNVTGPFLQTRPDLATDTWRGRFSRKYSKPAVFRPTIGEIR